MSTPKITGKIAKILNDRELVLSIGKEAGVKDGMRFKVMDKPAVVKDPDTGAELGVIARDKVKVKIVEVRPKMSIARTYETYQTNVGGTGPDLSTVLGGVTSLAIMSKMFQPPKIITRVRTLRTEESGLDYGPLEETHSFVKVGDPVELIPEDELGADKP